MEDFTVTSVLRKEDYKTPLVIIITILGTVIVTVLILQLLNIVHIYKDIPWMGLIFAILMLLFPVYTVRKMAEKSFPNLETDKVVDYKFGVSGMSTSHGFSESLFKWSSVLKCEEMKDYLVLITNSKVAFFVKKDLLSQQQIEFIQSKILKN